MSAFLTSLGSIAGQYGEAKSEKQTEDFAREQKLKELSTSDAYLQLAKQAEKRQADEFEQRKKSGDMIEFKDGRIWSVSQGKFIDQQRPDPAEVFKRFFTTLDPRAQKILGPKAQMIAEEYPYDQKEMMKSMLAEADKAQTEVQRQDAAVLTEKNRKEDAATKHQEHEADVGNQRQWQERFAKMMTDYRGAGLTPAAEKVVMTTQPTLEQVDRLMGDIKKLGLEKNNQSGYLFRSRLKYAMGQASPGGTLADDIAGLSLGSVIEAGSAMQGTSRSLVALKKALQHTPNPWVDSPMLINRKLTEIRQRLQDVVNDAKKYGTKRGIMPEEGGGATDPAVQQYLQSIGVTP